MNKKRSVVVLGLVVALLALTISGMAFAGHRFARQHRGRILPGATIAGLPVGGMSEAEALRVIRAEAAKELDHPITLTFRRSTETVTPRELGARSDARAAVRAALAASEDTSFFHKTRMGLFDGGLDFERDVAIKYPGRSARDYLETVATGRDRRARDAALDYSSGWVKFVKERAGLRLRIASSKAALLEGLRSGSERIDLDVAVTAPDITLEDYSRVLLVRIGENRLYLYEDGKITRMWSVATGLPQYPTPTGVFTIELKRYLPTWVNPSPDTWGADLPASIAPGPGNPLGLRALNWSAPAIRFHGTTNVASLGHRASHGCVRMANADVISLYDLVDVGTTIVSVDVGGGTSFYGGTTTVDLETSATTR